MKRLIGLAFFLCLLFTGCGQFGARIKDPVTFYYLRAEYQYSTEFGVIASEEREASGHRDNLSYLLALYLIGPSGEELVSPIPRGVRFLSVEQADRMITLNLSDTSAVLTDAEYSLACACLTLTCLDLIGTDAVTINSGARSVTMTRDNLILYDSSMTAPTEETQ